jgi:hypothetical protein
MGATVTSTSTSMFSVTFTSIPSLSLLQLTWFLRISSVRLELGMLRAHHRTSRGLFGLLRLLRSLGS